MRRAFGTTALSLALIAGPLVTGPALLGSRASVAQAAEPNEAGAAAAEELFQEGRRLADAKRFDEACPKFLASQKLAPAIGTLLNLADCYEKAGLKASAWARFHEAIALSQRMNRPDREKTARERAERLEGQLVRLTVIREERDTTVKLDGNELDPTILGTGIPVDPGSHTIEATAKGKPPFSTTIDVDENNLTPSVTIPKLRAEAPPPPKEPVEPPADRGSIDWNRDRGATQRGFGIAAMGLGGAGVAVGAVFGVRAMVLWSGSKDNCNAEHVCSAEGYDQGTSAKSSGNVSTIAFIAGGALFAGGLVLYLTAPRNRSDTVGSVRVGMGPGSVLLGGTF